MEISVTWTLNDSVFLSCRKIDRLEKRLSLTDVEFLQRKFLDVRTRYETHGRTREWSTLIRAKEMIQRRQGKHGDETRKIWHEECMEYMYVFLDF